MSGIYRSDRECSGSCNALDTVPGRGSVTGHRFLTGRFC